MYQNYKNESPEKKINHRLQNNNSQQEYFNNGSHRSKIIEHNLENSTERSSSQLEKIHSPNKLTENIKRKNVIFQQI